MKTSILLALSLLLPACATSQFTPIEEVENVSGISVLYDYPTEPYRTIGLVDFDYYRPGLRAPTVTDALPRLKAKAKEVGGNAFIVRGQRPGQIASRSIIVSMEVLAVEWSANR